MKEAERIGREIGISKGISQGISKEVQKTIKKMLAKDFKVEVIADIIEVLILEVEMVQQELIIKTHFEQGRSVKEVQQQFEKPEQKLLFSTEQLITLYQIVQIEQLFSKKLTVQAIVEKLEVAETLVIEIQEHLKK